MSTKNIRIQRLPLDVSRLALVGVALLLVGLLVMGAGAAAHVDARKCQLTETVVVTPVQAEPTTAYGDLSVSAQQVFDEALEAGQPALTRRGTITPGVVRYEGDSYRVETYHGDGCTPFHPLFVQAPLGGGLGLVVGGAVLARWG
jgi:hypothetical protein